MRQMVGVAIVAFSTVGLASASIAMVAQRPDVSTTLGRLLYAGAMANPRQDGLRREFHSRNRIPFFSSLLTIREWTLRTS